MNHHVAPSWTLLLLAAGIVDASAQTNSVTNCTETALQTALNQGGTVTFGCDGVIVVSQTISNTVDTVLDATGHQVTISGGHLVSVFHVLRDVHLTLVNLAIVDGLNPVGAGVYNAGGWLTLEQCRFSDNEAVGSDGSQSISGVANPGSGGGVYNEGRLIAGGCVFSGNSARGGMGRFGSSRQGLSSTPGALGSGGAVYNLGNATFEGCSFNRNAASGGAGGSSTSGFIPAVNSAPGGAGHGGALYNVGTATVGGCLFDSNSAHGGGGGAGGSGFIGATGQTANPTGGAPAADGCGGAIFNSAALTVLNNTWMNNTAAGGQGGGGGGGALSPFGGPGQDGAGGGPGGSGCGGALYNAGPAAIAASTFVSNGAVGGAGGSGGDGVFGGDASGGGSGAGGAVYDTGTASMINCTLTANQGVGGSGGAGGPGRYADGGNGGSGGSAFGGAINGPCSVTNCTLVSNAAGGGIGGEGGLGMPGYLGPPYGRPVNGYNGSSGSATNGGTYGSILVNTLLAADLPADTSIGGTIDDNHNLNSLSAAGLVGPLTNNGGPTPTMALVAGCPAIDSADTALAPQTDQRGFPRPFGAAADIGASEYGSWPVLSLGSLQTGSLMNLCVRASPGQVCRLLTGTTLTNWAPLATNTITSNGTVNFQLHFGAEPRRFYRVVSP